MNIELQQKLYDKYPKIFVDKDKPETESLMCFGICCGDGWYDLIDTLCHRLQIETDEHGDTQVVAFQIKEKFAELRFYVDTASDRQFDYINSAQNMSRKICEECGSLDAKQTGNRWIKTLCEKCSDLKKKK